MRAALLPADHRPLELTELPAPEPGRAVDVVVRVRGVGSAPPGCSATRTPGGSRRSAAASRVVLRTQCHRLEEVNDVLEMLRHGEVFGRAVLVPG